MTPKRKPVHFSSARVPGLMPWQGYFLAWGLGLMVWKAWDAVLIGGVGLLLLSGGKRWRGITPLEPGNVGLALAFTMGLLLSGERPPHHLPEAKTWMLDREGLPIAGLVTECKGQVGKRLALILENVTVSLPDGVEETLDGALSWTWKNPVFRPLVGDRVVARLQVKPLHGMKNPGCWDYEAYQSGRGVRWTAWSKGDYPDVGVLSSGAGLLHKGREALRQRVESRLAPHESQGRAIIMALLFGDRFWLDAKTMKLVRAGGVAHTLALSGLHVGFVTLLGFMLAWGVGAICSLIYLKIPRQKLGVVLAFVSVAVYLWLGDFSPTLVRASAMFGIWGALMLLGRQNVLLDGLMLALSGMLVVSPGLALDLRLQLSVLAVTGIAAWIDVRWRWGVLQRVKAWDKGEEPVRERGPLGAALWYLKAVVDSMPGLERSGPVRRAYTAAWRSIWGVACVSLAAQLAILPLIVWNFGVISPNLFLNMLWIPLLALVVMPLGMAGTLLTPLPWGAPAVWCLGGAAEVGQWFVDLLNTMEERGLLRELATFRPSWPAWLGYWGVLLIFWLWMRHRFHTGKRRDAFPKIWCGIAALCLALLVVPSTMPRILDYGAVKLTLIDVGQGQSILIQGSEGRRLLLDGGGFYSRTFDMGRSVVGPVCTLDHAPKLWGVALSHPDIDHMRGLAFPLQFFSPRFFATNGAPLSGYFGKELMEAARRGGVPRKVLQAGAILSLGQGIVLEVLHPPENFVQVEGYGSNNASLVMRLAWNGKGLALLPGDVEREGLASLLDSGVELDAEVLVAPHHGSSSSILGGFYDAVSPQSVLASAGYMNRWGFPDPELRMELAQRDIDLFVTSESGAIRVTWKAEGASPEIRGMRAPPGMEKDGVGAARLARSWKMLFREALAESSTPGCPGDK